MRDAPLEDALPMVSVAAAAAATAAEALDTMLAALTLSMAPAGDGGRRLPVAPARSVGCGGVVGPSVSLQQGEVGARWGAIWKEYCGMGRDDRNREDLHGNFALIASDKIFEAGNTLLINHG